MNTRARRALFVLAGSLLPFFLQSCATRSFPSVAERRYEMMKHYMDQHEYTYTAAELAAMPEGVPVPFLHKSDPKRNGTIEFTRTSLPRGVYREFANSGHDKTRSLRVMMKGDDDVYRLVEDGSHMINGRRITDTIHGVQEWNGKKAGVEAITATVRGPLVNRLNRGNREEVTTIMRFDVLDRRDVTSLMSTRLH